MSNPVPESLPPIRHPARFIPITALATGEAGAPAAPVGAANPLPTREAPVRGVRPIQPGMAVASGCAVLLDCSAQGRASLMMADGSRCALTVYAGLTVLPFAVTGIEAESLTAVLNAWVLD